MSSFEILGGHKLHGTIHPQGAKEKFNIDIHPEVNYI